MNITIKFLLIQISLLLSAYRKGIGINVRERGWGEGEVRNSSRFNSLGGVQEISFDMLKL